MEEEVEAKLSFVSQSKALSEFFGKTLMKPETSFSPFTVAWRKACHLSSEVYKRLEVTSTAADDVCM